MSWTGVPTQTLWLAAAIGAAGLVLLFLLRPRPRLLAVPSHVLWRQVVPKRMNPLVKELIALLLQLCVLGGLLAALGQPICAPEPPAAAVVGGPVRPGDTVLVVDGSASMAAREGDRARIDVARERVEQLIAGLADGERMAVVLAGPQASVAVPLTDDVQRLGLAARTLRASAGRADLDGALTQAVALLGGEEGGGASAIRVFSDAPFDAPALPDGCALIPEPVGRPRANLAIAAFDVRATDGLPARVEAFVRVTSHADHDARVTLSVETPSKVLGRASYTVPAGGSLDRVYHFMPPDEDRVEVVLRDVAFELPDDFVGEPPVDALALDDRAYAFLPGIRPARALLVTRGNQYLAMALQLIPGLALDQVTPDAFPRGAVAAGRYDAVFYDSFTPESPPPVAAVFINPPSTASGFSVARRVDAPVTTDWNLGHPLFANLVLHDLNVSVSGLLEPGDGDTRLIGTPSGPIALARERGGVRQVAFGFDFADSDLPLRLAFPQMLFNTVLWMREGRAVTPPAGRRTVARDPLWIDAAEGLDGVVVEPLVDDEGAAPTRRRGTTRFTGDGPVAHYFDRPGFYQLDGAADPRPLAVSLLDPVESELRGTQQHPEAAALPAPRPGVEARAPVAPPWIWLGLAALLLLVGEFAVVNR